MSIARSAETRYENAREHITGHRGEKRYGSQSVILNCIVAVVSQLQPWSVTELRAQVHGLESTVS